MIDFRYHLVSLVAVLLALAVGITLGAGPLRQTIGDALTGQVDQLRTENSDLKDQVAAAGSQLDGEERFIDASAAALLPGRLTGHTVAVVELGAVASDTVTAVTSRLTQAGAAIGSTVTLTATWTDPAQRSYRQALAGTLATYLSPAPAADASADALLGQALVQALTGADASNPGKQSDQASVLSDLLASKDTPLVTLTGSVVPADTVLVIAPPPAAGSSATAGPAAGADQDTLSSWLALLSAAHAGSKAAVLADGPRGTGSLVDALLADSDLAGSVSSVSGIGTVSAQVSVPLAIAAQLAGTVGHYGHASGETTAPPLTAAAGG